MRVDGNFQVGNFSIDDLTVNDDLNVTDELTVGGNTYAQFLETALDINCKGDLLVEETIVADGVANLNGGIAVATDKFTVAPITGNTVIKGTLQVDGGISGVAAGTVTGAMQYRGAAGDFDADDTFVYTPATKRLRVDNGTGNTADIKPTAVTVADASGEGELFHNRLHISDPTDTHIARVRLNGSTMEVGPSTATTLALQTNGTTRATVNASTGQISVDTNIGSTSTTTGSVVVTGTGGAGIGGRLYVGGNTAVLSTTASTTTTNGALVVSGGVGISGAVNIGGALNFGSLARAVAPNFIQDTTSGTFVEWLDIPSTCNVIEIQFYQFSATASFYPYILVGDGTTYQTTNYSTTAWRDTVQDDLGTRIQLFTNSTPGVASDNFSGVLRIKKIDAPSTGAIYVYDGQTRLNAGVSRGCCIVGHLLTPAATPSHIRSVRLLTSAGNLDAGKASLLYY